MIIYSTSNLGVLIYHTHTLEIGLGLVIIHSEETAKKIFLHFRI